MFSDHFNGVYRFKRVTCIVSIRQFECNVGACRRMEDDALKHGLPIVTFNLEVYPLAWTWNINHESPSGREHIKGSQIAFPLNRLSGVYARLHVLVPGAGLEPATFGCLRHHKGFARHTIALKAAL